MAWSDEQQYRAGRERWITEVIKALDQAQALAWALGFGRPPVPEARVLYAELENIRLEIDALRSGRWTGEPEVPPNWSSLSPWGLR